MSDEKQTSKVESVGEQSSNLLSGYFAQMRKKKKIEASLKTLVRSPDPQASPLLS